LDAIDDLEAPAFDFSCHSCAAPLSWRQWLNGHDVDILEKCATCRANIYSESFYAAPPVEVFRRIATPAYLETTWYHTSARKDWAPAVRAAHGGTLLVHAGSKLAALSRADDLYWDMPASRRYPLYLHAFRLRSTRNFAPRLLEDAGDAWQERLDVPEPMPLCADPEQGAILTPDGYHGAPYYNRYELPGDVSILFAARLVQLSTVETVQLFQP
jgi:hypothetical protein